MFLLYVKLVIFNEMYNIFQSYFSDCQNFIGFIFIAFKLTNAP